MSSLPKERLDILVMEAGGFESREKARAAIMAGIVYINQEKCDKAGTKFDTSVQIEIRGKTNKYVSRGGYKLEKAIELFAPDIKNKVAMDVGASTGGFTDCMLHNGVKKVYAIDVGYGQLAYKLRADERVICMERTNIRYITSEDIGEKVAFATIDVSFISLKKVIPALLHVCDGDVEMVTLIKPQFEAGREQVGKRGVVRDADIHVMVISDILTFMIENGFTVKGLTYSPIKGPEGNIEYLAYIRHTHDHEKNAAFLEEIKNVVAQAHEQLSANPKK